MIGLVFGQRYDHTWYGPAGHTRTDARRIAARGGSMRQVRAIPQRSGAILYSDGTDHPEGLAIWIPAHLRPDVHYADVEAWIDAED